MNTQESKKHNLMYNPLLFLILFLFLAFAASGEDYVVRVNSLEVSKVSEERFQIKGEITNNTDKELKRIAIKFKVFDSTGKVVEEDQILPFVNPIPPRGSSSFLMPIRYSRNMEMEKVTIHFINLVGKELSVDSGRHPLEFKVPR